MVAAGSRDASAQRSRDGVWIEVSGDDLTSRALPRATVEYQGLPSSRRFVLDDQRLVAILAGAPREFSPGAAGDGTLLSLPMPDGRYADFRIEETQVLSERLQAELPDMRTYIGRNADGMTLDARLDRGPNGFHAMIRTLDDFVFVRPVGPAAEGRYESYHRSSIEAPDGVRCEVADASDSPVTAPGAIPPSGATLSAYDIAISVTGEYTSQFGGRAGAQAQITTTINQLNGIYEPEVAIRFHLTCVAIPATASGDRYADPNTLSDALIDLNTTVLNDTCGVDGYDIGHLLHRRPFGYSGFGRFAAVCTADRGVGVSTGRDPTSGVFLVDLLAHEVGHQFNARHTFNSASGAPCTGQRSGDDAYEIASGTTIMSYTFSGCPEDIPGTAIPFFHTHSFDQITHLRDGAASCRTTSRTGNQPPLISAGPDRTIPRNTRFTLTATGSDPDGDPITYQWEQFDRGNASPPLDGTVNGPIFRGFSPSPSPSRTFPNSLTGSPPFEFLPTVDRTLHFRCTARDNRTGGGGVNHDEVVITVQGEPFVVTSPNGGESLLTDCLTTVTWTVGGGSVAANVNILLSTDGGSTFPTTLAAGVPNDGSHEVRLPCLGTAGARVMVEAAGNVFFDLSNANFRIANTLPAAAMDATGGVIGPSCEFLVPFSARITDNCRVDPGTVRLEATSLDGRSTVDAPVVNVNVADPGDLRITGTVRVSALTGCPARVRLTVEGRDGCGSLVTHSEDVEINDLAPPGIAVTLNDRSLWPPNHGLETITADVVVTDNCPNTSLVLKSVTSNEPEDDRGDGNTGPDIVGAATGTPDIEFQLRAERSGRSTGRVYTVVYEAADACGNRTEAVATVRVEHDRSAAVATAGDPRSAAGDAPAETRGAGASPAPATSAGAAPWRTGLVGIDQNPFFGATTVTFDVARATAVTVFIHDLAGRRVRSIASGERSAGRHTLSWDGRDDGGHVLQAGIYFVRLDAGATREVRKTILLSR